MTNREMLELAAKAAGLVVETDYDGAIWAHLADDHPEQACRWNPLTDDGDALRLAVKMKMDVALYEDDFVVVAYWVGDSGDAANLTEKADDTQDLYEATRRAIVRAAAEMAKADS